MNDLLEDVGKSINDYETPDMYIAAYLKAKGFRLTGSDKKGAQVYFYFSNSSAAHEAVKRLFRGAEHVVAIDFINAVKNIKSILYNI